MTLTSPLRSTLTATLLMIACGPRPPQTTTDGSPASTTSTASTTTDPGVTDTTTSQTTSQTTSPTTTSSGGPSTGPESSTTSPISGETGPGSSTGGSGTSTGDDTGGEPSPCEGLVTFKVEPDPDTGPWLVLDSPDDKAALAGVECLDGDLALLISGVGDATGLESLRIITGELMATSEDFAPVAAPFEGFDSLERIGHLDLFLANVSTLAGLESLHTIDGALTVTQSLLGDVHGLENLISVGWDVILGNCAWGPASEEKDNIKITSLAGLESLLTIGGSLQIASSELAELTIPALEAVGPIRACAAGSLVSVKLPSLTTAASIQFDHYTAYPQLSAFELPNLHHLPAKLALRGTQLTDLAGLAAIDSIGGSLELTDNPQLPTCTAQAFAAAVEIAGDILIAGNLPDQCGP